MISHLINSLQGKEASALSDLAILPPPRSRPSLGQSVSRSLVVGSRSQQRTTTTTAHPPPHQQPRTHWLRRATVDTH
ncbi:hypothetical protein CABS03_10209 [Colletotrichum abscissum]|uniref:Uncharacterized protein n=1 Tax=Colletotrichum abscissum TaxID=1671311 RepID=A0A9P9XL71_9PEZI|nr:hypothetical protein CABS02_03888 [Colletotrichum abscissum]